MDNDTIVEDSLDPIRNLIPTPPIPPGERNKWSPMVWEIEEDKRGMKIIGKLERVTISMGNSIISTTREECYPRNARQVFDFILQGGTCYLPCNKRFLDILACYLPYEDKVKLAREGEVNYGNYTIMKRGSAFSVRKSNTWGRVYSFWEAFPKYAIHSIDEYEYSPIGLDEFTTLFILEASELQKEGFSIAVLHSPISVVSAYLLGGFSRSMFGGIDKIPPTVLEHAHQAYKGSRFEGEKNIYGEGDYQDISMAFPSEVAKLTSASPKNMDWHDVSEYLDKDGLKTILLKDAFYAFILCYVEPTEQFRFSPVTLRYSTPFGMRLAGLFGPQILWLTLPEYQLIVLNNLAKVQVLEGSLGIPTLPNMRLRGAMEKFQRLRDHEVIGRVVKGASQTIVGKMGSMWIDTVLGLTPDNQNLQYHLVEKTSPLFNLIYSCHVNGAIRAKITGLALKYGASSIRADGILVPVGTKIEEFSNNGMGGLKLKSSGKHLNPDDMLLEGPESTHLLDSIMSEKPNSETFLYPRRIIRTLRGELIRGKNFNNVGVVEYEFNRRRRLGSRKRIPTNKPTRQILLSEGIKHSPPKGKFGLIYIRREGGGYDYY